MELVVRKTDLLRELQLFQGIVERKNTIPILANVLIEASDGEVKLLATDLEVGLRSRCDASVAKRGSLTLPAKKLYEIIKALPETDVRIEEDKNGVKVAADRFDSRMQTLPREDFPDAARGDGRRQRDACPRRAEADGREDAVRDHRRGHALFPQRRAVHPSAGLDEPGFDRRSPPGARDGAEGERQGKGQVVSRRRTTGRSLPRKTLLELGRLLSEGEGEILYERGENHLFFSIGGRLLISRMIDGQFPAFERVIPKSNDKRVEFDRDRLTSAVRRVALLSNERSRAVKFLMDKGKVEIASSSPEFGEAKEVLMVDYTDAAGHDLLQRAVRARFPRRRRDRFGRARVQGRDEPGGDEADRRGGLRLHLRDHADEGLTV